MFTLSTTPALVTSMPFLKGSLSITNTTSHMVTHMNYYGGLNAFVVEDCSRHVGSPSCPPHVQDWPSVQCEVYFDNCDKCRDSTAALVMPTIMAFVTQALQILGDIQRSTVKGDFHFMKM